jgi:hypothetical protein
MLKSYSIADCIVYKESIEELMTIAANGCCWKKKLWLEAFNDF